MYERTSENRDYRSENRPLNFDDIFKNYGETFGVQPASPQEMLTKEETTIGKYQLAQTFLR